jgi:hypothetical protein
MIINDARYTREVKSRIATAKPPFNKKKAVTTSRLDLNLRNKTSKVLHLGHSIVWCWRRMEKIVGLIV